MEFIFFYIFSAGLLVSSICTIIVTNSVYAVFFLVLAFVNSSGLLFLLSLDFFAILFLIIYVGAIAVVFLFVVIILNLKETEIIRKKQFEFYPISLFFFFCFILEVFFIQKYDFIAPIKNTVYFSLSYTDWIQLITIASTLTYFGHTLYTYYIFFFLISGIILLVAIVSSISLTTTCYSNNKLIKNQLVFEQLSRSIHNAIFKVKLDEN